jgi:hypothetical protein
MPSEIEFQFFFKYNKWLIAVNTIMLFIILCIIIWFAFTVNSKIKEFQNIINIINILKEPLDKLLDYLVGSLKPKGETVLQNKESVLNKLNEIQNKVNF